MIYPRSLFLLALLPTLLWAQPPKDLHDSFDALLKTHVHDGSVSYKDLRTDPQRLNAYLSDTWPEVNDDWRIRYTSYDWSLNDAE